MMPDNKFKTAWTMIIVALLIYTAIFVPYRIAFLEDDSDSLIALEACVDVLFFIDIIVSFLSAIEHPTTGKLIVDHKQIAKIYLQGWFWLDFLACFPFNLVTP